jgi:hypothetical protein
MTHITVVIPTYNRADCLPKTLDSVLAQTYGDYDVVVVDDGSTDETQRVLGGYTGLIQVVQQPNLGVGQARNTGIRAAKGQYIAFLDSDDIWIPKKLELQVLALESDRDLKWVYSDAYAFDGETGQWLFLLSDLARQYEGEISKSLLLEDFIPSPTPVVARSVFDEVGSFSDIQVVEDWEMWLRIAARYPIRRVPQSLAGYRVHQRSVTRGQHPVSHLRQRLRAIEMAVAFDPSTYQPHMKLAMARQFFIAGKAMRSENETESSRVMFRTAITYAPGMLASYPYWASTFLGARLNKVFRQAHGGLKDFRLWLGSLRRRDRG